MIHTHVHTKIQKIDDIWSTAVNNIVRGIRNIQRRTRKRATFDEKVGNNTMLVCTIYLRTVKGNVINR